MLGEALARCPGVRVVPVSSNIVVAQLEGREAPEVAARLAERGILAGAMDASTLRVVSHQDVSRADCERAADVLVAVLS